MNTASKQNNVTQHPLWQRIKAQVASNQNELEGSIETRIRDYFKTLNSETPSQGLYERVISEVEKPLIKMTLDMTRGNQLRAARILGINRNTLHKKVKELGIKTPKKSNAVK